MGALRIFVSQINGLINQPLMGSSADWLSVYSTEAHRPRPPKVKEQQKLPAKYLEGRDDTAGLGDPYKQKRPDKTENVHLCVSSLY